MRLGIIGGTGWLGKALAQGVLAHGIIAPGDLAIANRRGATDDFAGNPGVRFASVAELCAASEVIVLSVRPEDFPLPGIFADGKLVVSFLARTPFAILKAAMPGARLVRAMPNGGASTGTSWTPWTADAAATGPDSATVAHLLSAIGTQDAVPGEGELDYLAALSGSGAAYPALMAEAMLAHARARGLPEAIARKAVETVVCGSAPFLAGRIETASELVESYRAYRGVTEAGIDAALASGFATAIAAALEAAAAKAAEPVAAAPLIQH